MRVGAVPVEGWFAGRETVVLFGVDGAGGDVFLVQIGGVGMGPSRSLPGGESSRPDAGERRFVDETRALEAGHGQPVPAVCRPIIPLLSYQRADIESPARFSWCCWSRQTGKSFTKSLRRSAAGLGAQAEPDLPVGRGAAEPRADAQGPAALPGAEHRRCSFRATGFSTGPVSAN